VESVVVSILKNQPTRTVALFSSRFSGSILVSRDGSILVSGHTPGPRWEDFEVEVAQLRARVATLERENGELSKLLADRDKNLTVMGAELARLEREWRARRHG
jgi:hypothetical protein